MAIRSFPWLKGIIQAAGLKEGLHETPVVTVEGERHHRCHRGV
jgi:hypothetical protein